VPGLASRHFIRPELNPLTVTEFSCALAVSPFSRVANREKAKTLASDLQPFYYSIIEPHWDVESETPLVDPLTIAIKEEFSCWSSTGKSGNGL